MRLVTENSTEIIETKKALELAYTEGLDLVVISPNAEAPICKIMDYNKFLYEQSKKKKENKKNQKMVELKEIRLSPTIEEHDIQVKVNNAKRFIKNGDKIKITIRFRGRQNNNKSVGFKIMDNFFNEVKEIANIEKSSKLEGNNMIMILTPKINIQNKA